jgi:hypothetical protein
MISQKKIMNTIYSFVGTLRANGIEIGVAAAFLSVVYEFDGLRWTTSSM